MRTLDLNKVDVAAKKYYDRLQNENLIGDHDMIVFTSDYEFHVANSSLVKLSEEPKNIIRAYRIGCTGNLILAY